MKKIMCVLLCLYVSIGMAIAQSKATGTVVSSEDNSPVIGASVVVKGTTIGTVTNFDGEFTLSSIPEGAKTLVISYVGMEKAEVQIKPVLHIVLQQNTQDLDEVIVVAYGTAKKSSFTGSAATVNAAVLDKRVITNITAALEGNASGVQVTSALGQPGSSSSIRIRGFGSVNASNSPLYVVDGAIYNGSMSDLNPADIESVTVLKDAASTSLYGSSAGNGVILITTKKGSNAAEVNLTINQGWSSRAYKDYARVNAWQYYPLQWEMLKNAYLSAGKDAATAAQLASNEIASTLKYNPFTGIDDKSIVGTDGLLNPNATSLKWGDDLDWEDAAYNTGYRQEYTLSYNSKTEKSDSYTSVSYLNDEGYMMKTNFERYSARLNHNIYPVKWFKSGVNLSMARSLSDYSSATSDNSSGYANLTRFVRNMAPIYPVHKHDLNTGEYLDADGNVTRDPSQYVYDYLGARLSSNGRDAIAETELNSRNFARTNLNGRGYITLTPIEGLNITGNYAIENTDYRQKVYENPYVGDGTAGPGRLSNQSTRTLTQTLNQLVSYGRTIGKHTFDVLLGHENYSYKYEYLYGMKLNEIVAGIYDFGNFTDISSLSSYTDNYKKEGYFARLNYDFESKYYVSASYRHDGSSRFAKDNRWGDFWSFGGAWRISQETFMKDLSWLDDLKLRASYGETGSDAILDSDGYNDYYPYQTLYSIGINNGAEAGAYFSNLANKDLKWETQVSTDVALEFTLFDRLTGVVEYFSKASRDLLYSVSLPTSNGVSSETRNIGKIKNTGLEIGLEYKILKTDTWRASVGVNATILKNEITSLPAENRDNGLISGSKKLMEGKSMYEYWLRQWYGVNPDNGDGLYLFDSEAYSEEKGNLTAAVKKTLVEKDGKQLTNSYQYAKYDFSGKSIPSVYGGFNFSVGYKDFELTTVFSYSLGGKMLDLTYANLMSTSTYGDAMSEDVLKAWKKAGDITSVPRLDYNSTHATSVGQSYSTRWLVSADYLNLRSIALTYNLPRNLLKKVLISNARVNLNAENLFMLKARQGLNPQGNYTGLTYNEYMPVKNITLGLNLSF